MSELESDLVRDYRLPTEFISNDLVQHSVHETNPLRPARSDAWERGQAIGVGGSSTTWLETCVKGPQKGKVRAVKIIKDYHRDETDRGIGLQAAIKFSQNRVCRAWVAVALRKHPSRYLAPKLLLIGELSSSIASWNSMAGIWKVIRLSVLLWSSSHTATWAAL